MVIRADWLDDSHRVIVRQYEGVWTWAEFYSAQEDANVMLRSVEHTVHQIFDFSKSTSLPPNTLTHLRNSGHQVPPNTGMSIVITRNEFYLQMYRVLNLVFPSVTRKVVVVPTYEAALEKVRLAESSS